MLIVFTDKFIEENKEYIDFIIKDTITDSLIAAVTYMIAITLGQLILLAQ